MSAIAYAINEIIDTPQKKLSRDDAQKILQNCGIMDHSNKIQPEYSKIVIQKDQTKNGLPK